MVEVMMVTFEEWETMHSIMHFSFLLVEEDVAFMMGNFLNPVNRLTFVKTPCQYKRSMTIIRFLKYFVGPQVMGMPPLDK